jgi:hypothetical protein
MRSVFLAIVLVAFSMPGARAEPATAPAQASAPDWIDPSGAFSLSYRSLNWDLMSRVRPGSVRADRALQIISADKEYLWCDVQTQSLPLVGGMNQRSISEQTRAVSTEYVEGRTINDPLGGTRVVSSRILNAGDVAVRRVTLHTLDQQRPILRRDLVQFSVVTEREFKYVQIVCFVGFGSPTARAAEPRTVLETLRIRGEAAR